MISAFMAKAESFTQEYQLTPIYLLEIETFWRSGSFSTFQGVDNARINYASFITEPTNPCLIIAPGRSESYLKYQELIFDLSKLSYNIFIIDHRGQGLSERLLTNPNKGYVKHFDDYADDLFTFTNDIVQNECKSTQRPLLLTHSMGGAIGLRMMQKFPNAIKTALLASPMLAINGGGIPEWLAKTLISSGRFINNFVSNESWYFIGQNDYQAVPFAENVITHSKVRYQNFLSLYEQAPELQLGGVTINWLKEAIAVRTIIFKELDKLETPITILQAGGDTVVDNKVQGEFCFQLNQLANALCGDNSPIIIENARHELFFERDEYRNKALTVIKDWLVLNKS